MARLRIRNLSKKAGTVTIVDVDSHDEDLVLPARLVKVAAGASITVRVSQQGSYQTDFAARVIALPKNLSTTNGSSS